MNKELNTIYQARIAELGLAVGRLRAKSRGFVVAEIAFFVAAVGFVVLYTLSGSGGWPLFVGAGMLMLYFHIRHLDAANDRQIAGSEALRKVYEREVGYQNGDYEAFGDGEKYVCPAHPYTFDLDVFGRSSLFQRMNRTISTGGSDVLAEWLSAERTTASAQEYADAAGRRREAVGELSGNEPFVSAFKALGVEEQIDTASVRRVLAGIQQLRLPGYFGSRAFRYLTAANLVGFYLSVFLSLGSIVPASLPTVWGIFNFFLSLTCCHSCIRQISELIARMQRQVEGYLKIMQLVERQPFSASALQGLKRELQGAVTSFGQLDRILQKIDNRSNEVGIVLFNCFALLDITIVRHFLRWQRTYEQRADEWISAASRMDALVSMATFRMNEDKAVEAEVVVADRVVYEARGLYHPFLGEKAVCNDFDIRDHEYYIVTGANMAGKSTFLRSLGINYLLAMNGLPVFARSLRVSVFHLFTSMRTTDDLAHGISYFNAELLRLKQLLSSLRPSVPSLIILDEILKGTNSLDKLNGSRLFLQYIAEQNVTGVIATHDLELSKMEDAQPGRFHNYCFEIELGERITYSYKITRGVARNQNATYLLKGILGKE